MRTCQKGWFPWCKWTDDQIFLFQCQMEEQLAPPSLLRGEIVLPCTGTHSHGSRHKQNRTHKQNTHTCKTATSNWADQQLVIEAGPMRLFFCWFFFYLCREERIMRRLIRQPFQTHTIEVCWGLLCLLKSKCDTDEWSSVPLWCKQSNRRANSESLHVTQNIWSSKKHFQGL